MSTLRLSSPSLYSAFFAPVDDALQNIRSTRSCRSLSDREWIDCCVRRAIHQEPSGRGFLQRIFDREDRSIATSTYFDANATKRRRDMLRDVGNHIGVQMRSRRRTQSDPLADIASLADYEVFAGDGHYLAGATHDPLIDGTKRAVGHFFGLDLRTHQVFSMAVGEKGDGRKREHDMHALKRMHIDVFRQNTPRGKKVVWVWDRAGIDATQWQKWKQTNGIYFISRTKENMRLDVIGPLEYDTSDPANRGILSYELVTVGGQSLRLVRYQDPVKGAEYKFITSLTTVPPGIVAVLYKARWDIEKVFDETKQKLSEKKSWGSSVVTQLIQAETIALTHNLMVILEDMIEQEHGMRPVKDDLRRRLRLQAAIATAKKHKRSLSPLLSKLWTRATQRGLRYIRWLRNCLDRNDSLEAALARLRVTWEVSA